MSKTAMKRPNPEDSEVRSNKRRKPKKSANASQGFHDSLPWKAVGLPDRLDDWEGFVELEEIDDVEVIRDEHGKTTLRPKSALKNGVNGASVIENEELNGGDDGDSWSGFDDDDDAIVPETTSAIEPAKETKPSKNAKSTVKDSKKKHESEKSNSKKATKSGQTTASTFALLDAADSTDDIDVSAWDSLKLSPETMAALSRLRFVAPKPIQTEAIPKIFAGHDVIGKASTGSGKTLAFGIPIFERFQELQRSRSPDAAKSPIALILSPTRELAKQLETHISNLSSGSDRASPVIATLVGGLAIPKQRRMLKDADIVIGTPGRLWEVISDSQGVGASLKRIEYLVIDEADRLLSEGHFKEVDEILNTLDRVDEDEPDESKLETKKKSEKSSVSHNRQTLVFSATFDRGLQKRLAGRVKAGNNLLTNKESMEYLLSKLNFREEIPTFIDVNPVNQMAAGLKESMVECSGTEKDLYTYAVLMLHPNTRTLIFVNSINAVRRLTPLLQNLNIPALALHSGMPQKARLRSIERFSQATTTSSTRTPCSVLIATDVAARGLDIANVQLVLHYHLPRAADLYVHRSGRTARGGSSGSSILLCGPEEVAGVRRLVAKVHVQSALAASTASSTTADGDGVSATAAKQAFYIRTLDLDRRIVARLKPRVTLAKRLADATIAKEKHGNKSDEFLRAAAEDLGVEYDSEELDAAASGRHGRGSGRRKKERAARETGREELGAVRAELKALLAQRVNVGVSERYLAGGAVDVGELLRQVDGGVKGEFLGTVEGLGGL